MQRYRTNGPNDDVELEDSDSGFVGVDSYNVPENLPPGICQAAVNLDFSDEDAGTRGGFVCLPQLGSVFLTGSWTARFAAAANNWRGIVYGGGQFVAVSDSGAGNRVQTSPDGITWTIRASAADNAWTSVAYGNGLFVAVSSDGSQRVMTSPDGIVWTSQFAATALQWVSVVFGNGLFVAVAYDTVTNAAMTSPDGINWTARTTPVSYWTSVTYGNGLFVAVGQSVSTDSVMTSPDGVNWTMRVAGAARNWNSVAYGNGGYTAIAGGGVSLPDTMHSNDGITWTASNSGALNNWSAIAFGGTVFVAFTGSSTTYIASRDGINWTSGTSAETGTNAVAYGNGTFATAGLAIAGPFAFVQSATVVFVFASGIYSDPNDPGSQWLMLVQAQRVTFNAFGRTTRTVAIVAGQTVSEMSTVVQCNNLVYIFRGPDETPLYWTGDWSTEFVLAPTPTPAAGFEIIPNSNQATYYQNRLWVPNDKDYVSASDVLDFTRFDQLANEFNINTGDSDFLVTTFPFGTTTLVVFKHKSVIALTAVDGALTDVVATEITRQVGAIGINSVCSVGSDLVYVSDRNVNLLSLTSTSNALQHKTLPLSTKIKLIMQRVNWQAASKISMAYWDNKLYVALPLDNSPTCNTVCVYNFITEQWFGEWNFSDGLAIQIQGWAVVTYLGATRLHCVTEDGRIFVTGEGQQDISGASVSEIETSITTRAYRFDNNSHVARRMYADLETNRPNFSVTAYTDGASESNEILTNQTYSRAKSWIFGDSPYNLTNSSDDYNRAFRQDYSSTPADNVQPQSGFLPEMVQAFRFPIITRRKGRLSWIRVDNLSGFISIKGIGVSARAGDRTSLVQIA